MNDFVKDISLKIDWQKFTNANYWFSPSPFEDSGFWQEMIIFLMILNIFTWTLVFIWRKNKFKAIKNLKRGFALSTGYITIFLLIWIFFRTQSIFTLSNRLIGLAVILIWLVWIIWIIIYRLRKFPKLYLSELTDIRKEKYLPKQKGK